jgi:hypothetical protein
MVAGDLVVCQDIDSFECTTGNVRTGQWKVVRVRQNLDDEGGDENRDEDTPEDGSVIAVLRHSEMSEDLQEVSWCDVGDFSVDGGTWVLISRSGLEKMIEASASDDRAVFEHIADCAMDIGPEMPAGIVGEFFV